MKRPIIESFKYAFEGFWSSLKHERNVRVHLTVMLLVIAAGIVYKISLFEWTVCFLLFGAVISTELINTALEVTVDMIMPDKHHKAKLAKDLAAGAVLVWVFVSVVVGVIIFIPKILQSF